jgi:hypothetical protein
VIKRRAAGERCEAAGGRLVSWRSAAERDAIYDQLVARPGGRVWIGLSKVGGAWIWDDGTPARAADLPLRGPAPRGNAGCLEWGPPGRLKVVGCAAKRDFICMRGTAGEH